MGKHCPPAHDGAYKNMFSEPEMVAGLLRDFVAEDFIEALDFSTLEPCPSDFITEDLRERREDMIWRVKLREADQWCFVFVMLEFQSSVDSWMAVRILAYTALLYQDLIKKKVIKKGQLLPPVFPLVLYNGRAAWTACKEMAELVQPMPSKVLAAYQPRQRHYVLDEGRLSAAELDQAESITAMLFKLERSRDLHALQQAIGPIIERLQSERYTHLRRHITVWISRILYPRLQTQNPLPEVANLKELHAMLSENIDAWIRRTKREGYLEGRTEGILEGEAQGIEQGIEQGMAQGKAEGKADAILNILRVRAYEVSPILREKLFSISNMNSLDELLTVALTCASAEEFEKNINRFLS